MADEVKNDVMPEEDVLARLDAEFNIEAEMTSKSEEKAPEGKSEGNEKKIEAKPTPTRREVMQRLQETREAREKRLEEQQISLTEESSLRSAIFSHTVFTGEAASVEILESKDDPDKKEVILVVMLQDNIKVMIPFKELFTFNPIDMRTVDERTESGRRNYLIRKRAFAEKMLDAEISFTLTDIFPEGQFLFATGSRVDAMRRESKRAFGGSKPKVKIGDFGQASVIAVSRHALAVQFNGVDVVIPQYRLSLRYMQFVHQYYYMGQIIDVKVTNIRKDDDGNVLGVTLDPIACELAAARAKLPLLPKGTRVRGIVTNVYRPEGSKDIYIYAWLKSWSVPARVLRMSANAFGRDTKPGASLRLEVVGHDEKGRVSCIPLSEHGYDTMFNRMAIRPNVR